MLFKRKDQIRKKLWPHDKKIFKRKSSQKNNKIKTIIFLIYWNEKKLFNLHRSKGPNTFIFFLLLYSFTYLLLHIRYNSPLPPLLLLHSVKESKKGPRDWCIPLLEFTIPKMVRIRSSCKRIHGSFGSRKKTSKILKKMKKFLIFGHNIF